MNILKKRELTPLPLKSKSSMKSSNSLKRRRSLKSVKHAKLIILNRKSINRKNHYIGDRIMAHRGVMNFDIIESTMNKSLDSDVQNNELSVPNLINKTMFSTGNRILKLNINHQSPSYQDKLKNFLTSCSSAKTKLNRYISILPDRVLDAPDITPGFNNVMDWGTNNVIAVALSQSVYLWNSTTGKVNQLMKYSDESMEIVTSLKWLSLSPLRDTTNEFLAVGSSFGKLLILNLSKKKLVKQISCEINYPITSIAVKDDILSLGQSTGAVEHHMVHREQSLISINRLHKEVISHLKWSNNFQNIAVVSKYYCLSIFSSNNLNSEEPLATVRGKITDVVWSHKNFNILVLCCDNDTGGSSLSMYDVSSKKYVQSVNFVRNITCLYWSEVFDEIAAVLEDEEYFAINILSDNTFSSMIKLSGHRSDILTMVPNPTGEIIASIGEDEQIRFWNCFQTKDIKKIKNSRNTKSSLLSELERFR